MVLGPGKLKTSYAKLSAAMEEHISSPAEGWGQWRSGREDWKIADKMFSGKGDFNYLRKILTPGGAEGGVQGESVIKRLTNSTNPRNYKALLKIKDMEESGMITGGVSENLQNAYSTISWRKAPHREWTPGGGWRTSHEERQQYSAIRLQPRLHRRTGE